MSRILNHPARLIAFSFAAVIATGTLLLMVPAATTAGDGAPLLTALFTSTSAVCVTGLVVVDTATYWSPFGQTLIIVLIQVGGLGVMTLTGITLMLLGRRLGLGQRIVAGADNAAADLGSTRRLVAAVGAISLACELVVAVFLAARFATTYHYPIGTAIWHGVFHAVSAFNNAGFGLLTTNLVPFVGDPIVSGLVAGAIVTGGLGFPVWLELIERRRGRGRRFSLHAKLMFLGTAGLIILGSAAFLLFEWRNPATIGPLGVGDKLVAGIFQGITPRTAGFNSVDYGALYDSTLLSQMMLMFVGAGSASTAGGIKVTTFLVLILFIVAEARGRPDATAFGRRLPTEAVRQAFAISFIAINACVLAAVVIEATTPFRLVPVLFEAISAFGTVGLSTGITGKLDAFPQLILVALMYLGRTGPYTLALALALRQQPLKYRLPVERPLIG